MAHTKFPVEVLTPEGEVFAEEVEMLSTVTAIGSIGILANHEPLLAMLEPTELRLYRSDTDIVRFAQAEGYLQFAGNHALVLVEEVLRPEQLDRGLLQEKLTEARGAAERAPKAAKSASARYARSAAARPSSRWPPSGREEPLGQPRTERGHGALRQQAPGWFTRRVFNPFVGLLTRRGLPIAGSRVLEVRGRSSGEPRRTPVNPLKLDGGFYLVAPRGDTQWVRNLRASGEGRLLSRRHSEPFTAEEVPDAEKPAILRAYLKRWKFEVGVFFDGVGPDTPEPEMLAAAPKHPVFRLTPTPSR